MSERYKKAWGEEKTGGTDEFIDGEIRRFIEAVHGSQTVDHH